MYIGIISGLIAGYIASVLQKGKGSGCLLNIFLGIFGGFLGGWLFSQFGISWANFGWFGEIATAVIGAVILLWIFSKLK